MKEQGGKKIKARSGGVINLNSKDTKGVSKIKARTGGVINIVKPTDTIYKTDTVKVPVIKRDTVYLEKPSSKTSSKTSPVASSKPNEIKELPYPKMDQPILKQDNTRVDASKINRKAKSSSYEEKMPKTFNDFFPSNINMSGTSMGSYDKPMMKSNGLKMCGSQVGKHMRK
jgi:hypothetical protein